MHNLKGHLSSLHQRGALHIPRPVPPNSRPYTAVLGGIISGSWSASRNIKDARCEKPERTPETLEPEPSVTRSCWIAHLGYTHCSHTWSLVFWRLVQMTLWWSLMWLHCRDVSHHDGRGRAFLVYNMLMYWLSFFSNSLWLRTLEKAFGPAEA